MNVSFVVSLAIYGLVALFALGGAFLGYMRGIWRATFRFATVAASAVISFFLAKTIFPIFMSMFEGKTLGDIISSFGITMNEETLLLVNSIDIVFVEYAIAIPITVIIVPVLFLLIFSSLSGLLLIAHKIFSGMLGFTRKNNNITTRLLGVGVGLAQGLLAAFIILVPIVGIADVCDSAITEAEESYPGRANTAVFAEAYDSVMKDTEESNFIFAISRGACSAVYNSFIRVNIENETVDMHDTVGAVFDIFVLIGDLSETNWAALTESDKFAVDRIVDTCEDTRYMRSLTSSALKSISNLIDGGVIALSIGEPFGIIFDDLLGVLSSSSEESIIEDLETIKEVYYTVSDNGTFAVPYEDSKQMFNALLEIGPDGRSLFGRVNESFSKNERMEIMATHLSQISMDVMLKASGIDSPDTEQTLENVKGGLEEVLAIDKDSYETEEEYKADVSSKIEQTLRDNEIRIDEDQLEEITDYVITEFEGKENITDTEIADFMAKYYDTYNQTGKVEIPNM